MTKTPRADTDYGSYRRVAGKRGGGWLTPKPSPFRSFQQYLFEFDEKQLSPFFAPRVTRGVRSMKIKRNLPPEKRSWWKRTPEEPVTTKRVEVPWLRLKRRRPERG